ncbi:MAG: PIN domain-containing protein [Solirubrobacteraceae bacterium MAG38_C4-C5]|nr:PIN domain-containing protein [Candidatus Siliceabacter maunaloa]
MIVLDTSVVVASFGAWHEHHEVARTTLGERPHLAAHTALEAYSVLTRLPEPFRASPATVVEFLRRTFTTPRLTLPEEAQASVPARLSEQGVSGGAVYDGLIALTARAAGAQLLTLDRRALTTYARVGAAAHLLVQPAGGDAPV